MRKFAPLLLFVFPLLLGIGLVATSRVDARTADTGYTTSTAIVESTWCARGGGRAGNGGKGTRYVSGSGSWDGAVVRFTDANWGSCGVDVPVGSLVDAARFGDGRVTGPAVAEHLHETAPIMRDFGCMVLAIALVGGAATTWVIVRGCKTS